MNRREAMLGMIAVCLPVKGESRPDEDWSIFEIARQLFDESEDTCAVESVSYGIRADEMEACLWVV